MQFFTICFFLVLFKLSTAYKYSLPGDKNWPTDQNFQEFQNSFEGQVVLRGDTDNYKPITYNLRTNNPKPAVIVYVKNSEDIKKSLAFAKKYDLRISVWSTGHHQDIRNTADNSLQINLQYMKAKSVNMEEKTVTVETGNIFGEIIEFVGKETQEKYVCLSGADPSVGPYGWSVGGGHGRLTRMYGLGVDAIKSIELILVNGTQITASEQEHQDLFRSLRGSGGSVYGIATNITFHLYPAPGKVTLWSGLYLPYNDIAARFSDWMVNAPNNTGAYYLLNNFPSPYVFISAFCFGDTIECDQILEPLQKNCIHEEGTCINSYYDNYYQFAKTLVPDNGQTLSVYLVSTALDKENLQQALVNSNKFFRENLVDDIGFAGCSANAVLGGVSEDIDPNGEDTSVAPAMRKSVMAITCFSGWSAGKLQINPMNQTRIIEKLEEFSDNTLKKYGTDQWVYWNEPNHLDDRTDEWQQRYWGSQNNNYEQLLKVKKQYDPENFLTCYQCVGWDQSVDTDPAVCPSAYCSCSNTPNGGCSNNPTIQKSYFQQFLNIFTKDD